MRLGLAREDSERRLVGGNRSKKRATSQSPFDAMRCPRRGSGTRRRRTPPFTVRFSPCGCFDLVSAARNRPPSHPSLLACSAICKCVATEYRESLRRKPRCTINVTGPLKPVGERPMKILTRKFAIWLLAAIAIATTAVAVVSYSSTSQAGCTTQTPCPGTPSGC
jgi:hypothetical protein